MIALAPANPPPHLRLLPPGTVRFVLSRHCLVVAAIFVPYFGFMAALGCYMWSQVRNHENDSDDDEPVRAAA